MVPFGPGIFIFGRFYKGITHFGVRFGPPPPGGGGRGGGRPPPPPPVINLDFGQGLFGI